MERLGLDVGATVNLELTAAGQQVRCDVHLIGYRHGQSVLVTMPERADMAGAIRRGMPCVVRYLDGTSIVGFATSVLSVASVPYAYLHLRHPETVKRVPVRRAERIRTQLSARVRRERQEALVDAAAATIVDLSAGGALVTAQKDVGAVGDHVRLSFAVSFCGTERDMDIDAVVRNVGRGAGTDDGTRSFGLEFDGLERDDLIFLRGYLYEQISKRRAT